MQIPLTISYKNQWNRKIVFKGETVYFFHYLQSHFFPKLTLKTNLPNPISPLITSMRSPPPTFVHTRITRLEQIDQTN